jgi:hypothetical protein
VLWALGGGGSTPELHYVILYLEDNWFAKEYFKIYFLALNKRTASYMAAINWLMLFTGKLSFNVGMCKHSAGLLNVISTSPLMPKLLTAM